MKKLNILLISILITHTCFASVFRTNNSPFTLDKGKFDLSVEGSRFFVPPSADVIVGIPYTGSLGFGYGATDEWYIQMGMYWLAPFVETWYQWLGHSNENSWSSTVKLAAQWPGVFLISNSFGYTVENWLSVYGGLQVTADLNKYPSFSPPNKSDQSKPYSYGYGAFAGIHLNKNIFSESQLIYMLEAGYLNTDFAETKEKSRFWVPVISSSLSFAF